MFIIQCVKNTLLIVKDNRHSEAIMSMQQRNTVVSLVSFLLILSFFCLRVFQMVQAATFVESNVFRLWGIVIAAAIGMTIVGMILTNIGSAVVHSVRTNEAPQD